MALTSPLIIYVLNTYVGPTSGLDSILSGSFGRGIRVSGCSGGVGFV